MATYTVYLASAGMELMPIGGITVETEDNPYHGDDLAEVIDMAIDTVIDSAPGYFFDESELGEDGAPEDGEDFYYSSDHNVWLNTHGGPVVIMPNGDRLGAM